MRVSTLIERLQKLQEKHGDLTVIFENDEHIAWQVSIASLHVAEENEYPPDLCSHLAAWEMPEGFAFIKLEN